MYEHFTKTQQQFDVRRGDVYYINNNRGQRGNEIRKDRPGNGSISMEPDMLRPMMQQIIREEVRKALEGQDVSQINREMPTEVDLMEEEPLRMDQTMRQNVVDAISAFRRA